MIMKDQLNIMCSAISALNRAVDVIVDANDDLNNQPLSTDQWLLLSSVCEVNRYLWEALHGTIRNHATDEEKEAFEGLYPHIYEDKDTKEFDIFELRKLSSIAHNYIYTEWRKAREAVDLYTK